MDTNPEHVKFHHVLKHNLFFFFFFWWWELFLGYRNDEHQDSNQKTLSYNCLWSDFLSSCCLPKLVQLEVPWFYVTSFVMHLWDGSWALHHPKLQTGIAVAVNRCNTPRSSASPEAVDFPTEALSAWELRKVWWVQQTLLNCKCSFE